MIFRVKGLTISSTTVLYGEHYYDVVRVGDQMCDIVHTLTMTMIVPLFESGKDRILHVDDV